MSEDTIRPTTFKVPEGVRQVGYGHGVIEPKGRKYTTSDVYERDILRQLDWEEVLEPETEKAPEEPAK